MNPSQFPARTTDSSERNAPVLHATGSDGVGRLIDNAVANLNRDQVQALSEKAAGEALRLQVKMREQNLDYVAGKKTIEDHIDTWAMLDKSGRLTRQKVETTVNTGAGTMRIESKSGATCFVATASYRDANHPDVVFLRRFRDERLRHSIAGRRFIDWYWRTGPRLAKVVDRSEILRIASKTVLRGVVGTIKQLRLLPAHKADFHVSG